MGLFSSECKFESSVKQIPYSQEAVYDNISDLSNLTKVQDRVPEDKVNDFKYDEDTVSLNVAPVGELKLRICEREAPKCVKFELQNAPIKGNLWIQMLPTSDTTSKMRCTVGVDMNFFMRKMIEKQLKEGVEKLAEMLSRIPYGY